MERVPPKSLPEFNDAAMKRKFIWELGDPFDGVFDPVTSLHDLYTPVRNLNANVPVTVNAAHPAKLAAQPDTSVPAIPDVPALTAEAAAALGAQAGATTALAMTT